MRVSRLQVAKSAKRSCLRSRAVKCVCCASSKKEPVAFGKRNQGVPFEGNKMSHQMPNAERLTQEPQSNLFIRRSKIWIRLESHKILGRTSSSKWKQFRVQIQFAKFCNPRAILPKIRNSRMIRDASSTTDRANLSETLT